MFERLGPFKSAILLLLLVVISLFCGYRLGNFYHAFQTTKIEQLQTRLHDLYLEQTAQTSRIHTLEVELELERLASERSANMLKDSELKHYQVKKELAFYEKVMAPEKEADGIVIDKVIITPTQSPDHYRFQVILVQQKKSKRYAKGHINFDIKGSLKNKPNKLSLTKLSKLTEKDLSFNFQYFQIIKGEFDLPKGFKAEQLLLSVTLPKSRWQKYNRLDETFKWQKILDKPIAKTP